jgi:hypothetical protein
MYITPIRNGIYIAHNSLRLPFKCFIVLHDVVNINSYIILLYLGVISPSTGYTAVQRNHTSWETVRKRHVCSSQPFISTIHQIKRYIQIPRVRLARPHPAKLCSSSSGIVPSEVRINE